MNVREVLHDAAKKWPQSAAIVDEHGTMTFEELDDAVQHLEAVLTASGLQAREGLGVLTRNSRAFLIGAFAGLGVGATVMPVSHQLHQEELRRLQTRAPLTMFIDDRSGASPDGETLPSFEHGMVNLRVTRTTAAGPLVPHVPDAAFVRFTSGTTGTSKGVVISHESVLARTHAAREALDITHEDTVVWVLPMAYHFIVTIVMYVRYGACIALAPDMVPTSILETAARHQATLLYASPTHYRMLAADTSEGTLENLRLAISTASAIPEDVARAFEHRHHLPISQIYGIIEIGLPAGNLQQRHQYPDTIGSPLPGYEVAILDHEGQPVTQGSLGRLAMRGPGMFDAYMAPPRMRDEVLEGGWFMTGDLAYINEAGLIRVAGREKSMINRGGLKVFPEEVERVLQEHPAVRECRVYGVPHKVLGEVVQADVVAHADHPVDMQTLRHHCRSQLSAFKVPTRIQFVEALVKTGSGKVMRHAGVRT